MSPVNVKNVHGEFTVKNTATIGVSDGSVRVDGDYDDGGELTVSENSENALPLTGEVFLKDGQTVTIGGTAFRGERR
jgi:hypothetical protein